MHDDDDEDDDEDDDGLDADEDDIHPADLPTVQVPALLPLIFMGAACFAFGMFHDWWCSLCYFAFATPVVHALSTGLLVP